MLNGTNQLIVGSVSRFGKGFFSHSPQGTFNADSLTYDRELLCAIACINSCAHVKDPVVCVRVRWIIETLITQHARRFGSATLSQLASPRGKQPEFPTGKNLRETIQSEKKKKSCSDSLECQYQSIRSRSVIISASLGYAYQNIRSFPWIRNLNR